MSVEFVCSDPAALLKCFDDRIAQTEPKSQIATWQKKNGYYTHSADRWAGKAWLTASTAKGVLRFNIVPSKEATLTTVAYAYYHGHLIETFLSHFDTMFTDAHASALARAGDILEAAA